LQIVLDRVFRQDDVVAVDSGRSKPATKGRFKTSH
jgi:hypothetical protein